MCLRGREDRVLCQGCAEELIAAPVPDQIIAFPLGISPESLFRLGGRREQLVKAFQWVCQLPRGSIDNPRTLAPSLVNIKLVLIILRFQRLPEAGAFVAALAYCGLSIS